MIFGDRFDASATSKKKGGRKGKVRRLAAGLSLAQLSLGLSVMPMVGAAQGATARGAIARGAVSPDAVIEGQALEALQRLESATAIAMEPPDIAPADIIAKNRQLASVLPADTPMAFFLSTKEETWEALNQFELFSKISTFFSGSLTPRTLMFFPQGLQYAYDGQIQDWAGDQTVVAYLPDTTPRSIEPTDLLGSMYAVVPVDNPDELPPFLSALEEVQVSRQGIEPEKTVYEGVELWVWPTREVSWDEYYSPEAVPAPPSEIDPDALPEDANPSDIPEPPLTLDTSSAPEATGSKAVDPESSSDFPSLPEDFGEDEEQTVKKPGLTVAMMGEHLVFAPEASAVKTLIDYQVLGGPGLAESKEFLRSEYSDSEGAIARLYANLSEVIKFNLDGSFPFDGSFPSPAPLPPGLPDFSDLPGISMPPEERVLASQALKGITADALIYPQDEGMRLQGRLYGNGLLQSTATPELDYADSALDFLPAPTYSLSSGRNVAGFWKQVASGLALSETTRPMLEQARSVVSEATGLDLDTDLIGWMDREFVLFFFPSNKGAINSTFPGAGVEVGIAVQTSDTIAAQKALDAIDSLLGPYIVADDTVNNTPVVSWQGPGFSAPYDSVSYVSHSWVSEDTVLLSSGTGAMERLLNATAFSPLSEHPTFINATGSLANPNNGYSYVNMGATLSLIYSQIYRYFGPVNEDFFFQQVQSTLGTIRGLGATTSSTNEYWQLDTLMNLAPAEGSAPSLSILPPGESAPLSDADDQESELLDETF